MSEVRLTILGETPLMAWVDVPEVKPEMGFSEEELQQIRARLSPRDQEYFDRLVADGWTPFKSGFVEDVERELTERVEPKEAQQSQQTETRAVEHEQIDKPWEASCGTPGRAAEPQRDRM